MGNTLMKIRFVIFLGFFSRWNKTSCYSLPEKKETTWGVTNVQLISQNTVTVCFLSSYQLLVIPVDVKRRKKERNTQEFLPRRSTEAAAGWNEYWRQERETTTERLGVHDQTVVSSAATHGVYRIPVRTIRVPAAFFSHPTVKAKKKDHQILDALRESVNFPVHPCVVHFQYMLTKNEQGQIIK